MFFFWPRIGQEGGKAQENSAPLAWYSKGSASRLLPIPGASQHVAQEDLLLVPNVLNGMGKLGGLAVELVVVALLQA